jgi:hypothetical protein
MECARDLYSALVLILQRAPDAKYFGGYFDRDQRWGDLLYGDFVAAYSDRDASVYDDFRLYKWSTGTGRPVEASEDPLVEVTQAPPTDLGSLSQRLRETVSPLEFDAFSYAPDEINLSRFREMCSKHGRERRRDVYVAREGRNIVAALIAECGSEGESIFGLLDRCSIVWWPHCVRRETVKRQLLGAAVEHYTRLGRREAIFLDTDDVAMPDGGGFHFVSAGRRWLARLELIPAWRSYVDDVLRSRAR